MQFEKGTEPRTIINELLKVQYAEYEYEDFLMILKNRLRKYTGKHEVMFYNEEQLIEMLLELKVIEIRGL